jgi:hypothetical protein
MLIQWLIVTWKTRPNWFIKWTQCLIKHDLDHWVSNMGYEHCHRCKEAVWIGYRKGDI